MIGKLIKYEFKHTSKTMFTTWIVLAAATLMGSLALYRLDQGNHSDTTFSVVMNVIMLVLYIIALIGIFYVDFIYLCYHYYKTMYSSQGYLTHTLPLSPAAAFSVKIFAFFIWMLASSVLLVISVLVLLNVGSGGEFFSTISTFMWDEFIQSVNELFGISAPFLIFIFIADTFLGILWRILWVTTSMAIGQLFQSGRTGFSILAGFCIYMVNQVVNTILLAASGYNLTAFLDGMPENLIRQILGGSMIISAVMLIALYGICVYINKKKLNLE